MLESDDVRVSDVIPGGGQAYERNPQRRRIALRSEQWAPLLRDKELFFAFCSDILRKL